MVIAIYSVLIQTQTTMNMFSGYQSVFMDAIQKGQVGLCKWNPSGRDIDTALPDIHQLTDDKKEWRAIIIRSEADAGLMDLPLDAQNPYDFFPEGKEQEGLWEESENPLIRLTHMLGGAPAAEKEFESRVIDDGEREPFVIFEPVEEDGTVAEEHRAFLSKYEYDGVAPTSILLVTVRLVHLYDEENTEQILHDEQGSSMFWKRNRYPGNCRFLVFDYSRQGPVRREGDRFRFWLTILLLAVNKIDPAFLQAYRLYDVDIELDQASMELVFQKTVNRLNSTRYVIQTSLRRKEQELFNGESELPEYKKSITVPYQLPKKTSSTVRTTGYGLFSRGASNELGVWEQNRKQAEQTLMRSVKIADRALDKTADRARSSCICDEDTVEVLDRYQREDLTQETQDLYEKIVQLQGKLPTDRNLLGEDAEKADQKIRDYMRERMTSDPAIYTWGFGLLLLIAAQIPTAILFFRGAVVSWESVIWQVGLMFIVMLVCGLAVLFIQRAHLSSLIRDFNHKLSEAFVRLTTNSELYSGYLSAVVSHCRGRSYLDISKKKNKSDRGLRRMQHKHIGAIDQFLDYLDNWSRAFHLDVKFAQRGNTNDVPMDLFTHPSRNAMYSLDTGDTYQVEVNYSGIMIDSPYEFVRKFELKREELYEDDGQ